MFICVLHYLLHYYHLSGNFVCALAVAYHDNQMTQMSVRPRFFIRMNVKI